MDSYDRFSHGDFDTRSSGDFVRFLPAASVVVAAFSFILTTVVWRLVNQTAAVEAAVQESIVGINRFSAANSDELAGIRQNLARQDRAAVDLEARLAHVEATSVATLERIQKLGADVARQCELADHVRTELARSTAAIAQSRQELLERLAVHTDRNVAAREAMIQHVNGAITRMEETLLAQAADFQHQKRHFEAAAERDRATRRAMLNDATRAFAIQVEGLREILDGLRVDAVSVDAAMQADPVTSAVDVSEDAVGEESKPTQSGDPATAALDREGVLE